MNPVNYSDLTKIYRNILLQQQTYAYANMMASMAVVPAPPEIKLEPVAIPEVIQMPSPALPATPHSAKTTSVSPPCSFSLDTEIPREEIEGDIEVILVKNFMDILKKLETNVNGLRGKKFGYREVLDMALSRPIYPLMSNSATKRNRTSSFGSINSTLHLTHEVEEEKPAKKIKIENSHNVSCSSDEGRLLIDWDEDENAEKEKKVEKVVSQPPPKAKKLNEEYTPALLRFERLKQMHKKKPRFDIDSLDLTYHSNMARHFPGTENRSEEQQNRRDKNTMAARISRNRNKAYEKYLEQKSIDSTVENINLKRSIACLRVYANSLMKLNGFTDTDFSKMFESNIKEMLFQKD